MSCVKHHQKHNEIVVLWGNKVLLKRIAKTIIKEFIAGPVIAIFELSMLLATYTENGEQALRPMCVVGD